MKTNPHLPLTRVHSALVDGDVIAVVAASVTEPTHWEVHCKGVCLSEHRYKAEAKTWVETQAAPDKSIFSYVGVKKLEPVQNALQVVKTMLEEIKTNLQVNSLEVYLTSQDKSNFRFNIAKTVPYKGNRTSDKPTHFQACYDYLVKVHHATVVYGMEADDAMGIAQTAAWQSLTQDDQCIDSDVTVICTTDKDLRQIPGYNYNITTKVLTYITYLEGRKQLWYQTLIGDPTDNIRGLNQVGPVMGEAILRGATSDEAMKERVIKAYTDRGCTEDYYNEQYNLVHILENQEQYEHIIS